MTLTVFLTYQSCKSKFRPNKIAIKNTGDLFTLISKNNLHKFNELLCQNQLFLFQDKRIADSLLQAIKVNCLYIYCLSYIRLYLKHT